MSKTNDEIIWEYYKQIISLSDEDYNIVCDYMRKKEQIPGLVESVIHKADKKRENIVEHITG